MVLLGWKNESKQEMLQGAAKARVEYLDKVHPLALLICQQLLENGAIGRGVECFDLHRIPFHPPPPPLLFFFSSGPSQCVGIAK